MNQTLLMCLSFLTAFSIAAGGAIGMAFLALKGATPDKSVWICSCVIGLVSASKDMRSLLKLPPVSTGSGNTDTINKPTTPTP